MHAMTSTASSYILDKRLADTDVQKDKDRESRERIAKGHDVASIVRKTTNAGGTLTNQDLRAHEIYGREATQVDKKYAKIDADNDAKLAKLKKDASGFRLAALLDGHFDQIDDAQVALTAFQKELKDTHIEHLKEKYKLLDTLPDGKFKESQRQSLDDELKKYSVADPTGGASTTTKPPPSNVPSNKAEAPPKGAPADARKAPDGHWYSKNAQGKYVKWD